MLAASTSYSAEEKNDNPPRFEIRTFQVEGNTLIDAKNVEGLLSPFEGKDRDLGTVKEAVKALEEYYHTHGYPTVMVTLPEHEMENGVVRLKVTENRIGKITVEGNTHFDEANILRSVPVLRKDETPEIDAISRSIKLANENPAKKLYLQLSKGEKENEVDADVKITDERPWKIGITGDNTGTEETGRARTGVFLQHANVFNRDHLMTLQYIASPEETDRVKIYSAGYQVPFYSLGSSLQLIAARANVNSGTISAASLDMNVNGKGTIYGIRYNQNFARVGNYEHKLILALDYRAYETSVKVLGFDMDNDVTVHPVSLTYAGTWSREKAKAGFYLTGLKNLSESWGEKDTSAYFERVRTGATEDYAILRYGADLFLYPGADWQVQALINGQYARDPLVPGEQYGIGGADSVRGFNEREIINDRGYSGSLEIYTPDFCRLFQINAFQSRLLAFYDRGYVSRISPLPGETTATHIAGTGPGLRISGKRFTLSADLGFVVDPPDVTIVRWSRLWHLSATILF